MESDNLQIDADIMEQKDLLFSDDFGNEQDEIKEEVKLDEEVQIDD